MVEVLLLILIDNQVFSIDIWDVVYVGVMLDKVVISIELKYIDCLGGEYYIVDGMKVEGDKVVEEIR